MLLKATPTAAGSIAAKMSAARRWCGGKPNLLQQRNSDLKQMLQ